MESVRTPGTAAQFEARREQIAVLLGEGSHSNQEIADAIGVSVSTVKRCCKAIEQGGLAALAAKPHPGPKPKLTDAQRQQLLKLIERGALAAGFPTELWTCQRIAEVVQKKFGVSYHPDHLGRILHDLDCTPQLPRKVDPRQDPNAIEEYRKVTWPRIKKKRNGKKQASS
jgi:transposase